MAQSEEDVREGKRENGHNGGDLLYNTYGIIRIRGARRPFGRPESLSGDMTMVNQQSIQPFQGNAQSPKVLTPLQDHFLEKLTYFLTNRRIYVAELKYDPTLLQLLHRAIYLTYLDSLAQRVGDQARPRVVQSLDPSAVTPPSKH